MRVLLTGLPIRSHLVPALVPLAKSLRRLGHEVAIATGGARAAELEALGVEVLVLPDVLAPEQLAAKMPPGMLGGWRPEISGPLSVPLFNHESSAAFARNLLASGWQPDLIIRETNEYGGFLAADVLGVPFATVDIAPLIVRLVPDLLERLNVLRGEFDLAPIGSLDQAYGHLTAGLLPEPWYHETRPGRRAYRTPAPVETLDPAVAELPADGPLVLMSLGSNLGMLMSRESELLPIAVEALGSLPVRAVVASGQDTWTGPRPANVHVVPYVQQNLLLGACDVFVTHAGFSGVREALSAGVPMVAVPLFSDQPENASRLEDLGLGIRIDAKGLRPDILADAVRRVLEVQSFRQAARGFQRRILGLPTLDTFAEDFAGRETSAEAGLPARSVLAMDTPPKPGEPPERPGPPPSFPRREPPPDAPRQYPYETPTKYPGTRPPEFPPGVTPPSPER